MSSSRIRRAAALAVTGALAVAAFAGLGPVASTASSHREAPLVSADPPIDATDLYAFVPQSAPNTVALVGSWIPFEEPAGGPNFYLWAERTNYDINIDNDGDARADITYRWRFTTHHRNPDSFIYNNGPVTSLTDQNLLIYQTYDLTRIKGDNSVRLLDDARVVPSNVGKASMPGYNADLFDAGVKSAGGGRTSWVGQSDDAFFLDLRVFDLLYGGDFSEAGDDTLDGFNVNTMVLQVPKAQLRGPDDGVIGVWTTASRPSIRIQGSDGSLRWRGDNVQVSRLGMPLVNEVVVPIGSKDLLQRVEPARRRGLPPEGQRPRAAAPDLRGLRVAVPERPGLEHGHGGRAALGPGAGLPDRAAGAEQARARSSLGDAAAEHGHRSVHEHLLAARRDRRRHRRVPERPSVDGRHHRHRAPRDDGRSDPRARHGRRRPRRRVSTRTMFAFQAAFPYVAYPHSGSNADPH